jgi:heterotetrameric sarcosine oxidase delta subunit
MQQFPCPWCGNRSEGEFRYAGDAGVDRPDRTVDDKAWAQYLYFRRNAKGAARELWIHSAGCGRWIVLSRDTVTHVVTGSEPMA